MDKIPWEKIANVMCKIIVPCALTVANALLAKGQFEKGMDMRFDKYIQSKEEKI